MKVLVVSNNFIFIKDGKCWCEPNFYYILKRFSYLGEISLVARTRVESPIYVELDFVPKERVTFVKKTRVLPSVENTAALEKAVSECDLVIGYNPCVNAEYALKLAKKHGKKYMTYLVACVWDSLWNHSFKAKLCAPLRYAMVKYVTKRSDYVLYVTNEFLQRRYPNNKLTLGCSDVFVKVDDSIIEKRIEHLSKTDLSDTINLVTTASVHVKYKGQRFVIRALGRLKKKNKTNYHYYLIGSGDQTKLRKLAERCGVSEQLTFMGMQSHSRVMELLDEMHVYIHPSLTEGLPRSVVEAMSRGLFCIGSNAGAIPELIDSKYIVPKRSVRHIVKQLEQLNSNTLLEVVPRNVSVAQEYDNLNLEMKRKGFFDKILADNKK
jgi:glycosyltransferase involved in cell wall biosynthesis